MKLVIDIRSSIYCNILYILSNEKQPNILRTAYAIIKSFSPIQQHSRLHFKFLNFMICFVKMLVLLEMCLANVFFLVLGGTAEAVRSYCPVRRIHRTSPRQEIHMEHWWNDNWQGKTELIEEKPFPFHSVHQKSHMQCAGIEPRVPPTMV
jgi:hypothetical protein